MVSQLQLCPHNIPLGERCPDCFDDALEQERLRTEYLKLSTSELINELLMLKRMLRTQELALQNCLTELKEILGENR